MTSGLGGLACPNEATRVRTQRNPPTDGLHVIAHTGDRYAAHMQSCSSESTTRRQQDNSKHSYGYSMRVQLHQRPATCAKTTIAAATTTTITDISELQHQKNGSKERSAP